MLLDAPLILDATYVRFLADNADRLMSLHFSLHAEEAIDARLRLSETSPGDLAGALAAAPGPRKYALLNSRVHHPEHYADAARMKSLLQRLETLLAAGQVHGVVVADAYFLKALGRAGPSVAAALEAVPSVNAMLDSVERVRAWLPVIAAAGFLPPGKLNLDRSLNRDIQRLQRVGAACRDMLPGARLVLLANEGCIPHCPYKPAHDAHIALANMGAAGQRTFELNRCYGCVDHLMHDPSLCLCSPIIRPEDAHRYEGLADGLKVCGRTLAGPERLRRIVNAYLQGRFEGNLLELADSMDWLAERWELPNQDLPDDFWEQVCSCLGECGECGWRRRVFDDAARPRKSGLADLRTREPA